MEKKSVELPYNFLSQKQIGYFQAVWYGEERLKVGKIRERINLLTAQMYAGQLQQELCRS